MILILDKWSGVSEKNEVKGHKKGKEFFSHLYMNGTAYICLYVCVTVSVSVLGKKLSNF